MPDSRSIGIRRSLFARVAAAATGLTVLVASGLPGCNVIVPVAYVLEGPGKIPAEFELRETSTAVIVDDRDNNFPRTSLRAIVGVQITDQLIANEVLPGSMLVDARDMIGLTRALESSEKRVSIERIGREAGVEQVIYVQLEGFALTLDGVTPKPTAVCRVKVLDLSAGMRVFPVEEPSGNEITAEIREVDPALFESFAKRRRIEDDLAMRLGLVVAEVFYEHERVNLGENLGIR